MYPNEFAYSIADTLPLERNVAVLNSRYTLIKYRRCFTVYNQNSKIHSWEHKCNKIRFKYVRQYMEE